jgi:type I restriction enzyme S subunit
MSSLVQYGSSAKTSEDPTGIPVLRMGNIIEGQLQITELKYLPKSHDEFPALLLEPGDVLFNRTNSAELVGKTALYRGHPKPCSFASYLIRVRLLNGCLPEFLVYYINSVFGRGWISSVVSQQVGQANVNGTKLQALVVSLPPFAEQEIIVAEVERRMCLLGNLDNAIDASFARAERLRQSTLSRMFNGEAYSPRRVVTVNTGR